MTEKFLHQLGWWVIQVFLEEEAPTPRGGGDNPLKFLTNEMKLKEIW